MTSLPIINQGRSYYAGSELETEVETNRQEIVDIEVTIAPDMAQDFKQGTGFVNVPLIAGSFIPMEGSDSISILPGNWNNVGSLHYQYEGTITAFYLIGYTVSGLLTTISEAITFAIRHNSTILSASANVQHYNTSEYVTTVGFVLIEILPNDTIRLEADLLGAINDTLKVENVNLIMTKIAGLAL